MNRVSDASARRPRWRAVALVVLGLLLILVLGTSLWVGPAPVAGADPAPSDGTLWAMELLFVALALLVAAIAASLGAAAMRSRMAAALREARTERQALASVLDLWQWRTDSTHRLVRLLPPHGIPATAWSAGTHVGQTLWEHYSFDADAASGLAERMNAHAPLEELSGWHREAGGAHTHWQLRGTALFDAEGRFAGYLGTARPLQSHAEQACLTVLLDTLPGPAFVAAECAGEPRLSHLNRAARELVGKADVLGLGWSELAQHLPPDIGQALQQVRADSGAEPAAGLQAGEWQLTMRRHPSRGEHPGVQVLLLARTQTPAAPAAAASGSYSDQEAFSYTVSHDLRAPIRVVEGFTRIVKEDYGGALDRIGIDHLDRVLGAAARMNSMIDALLNLSQLASQPLARRPVDLSQLADYVVEDLRRGAPERAVEVHIEPGLATQGDPTLLRVALENLLGNAWKYTSRNSRARISLECSVQGERPVFCVRDDGAGFDMRFADRLFGVFQRLHSASEFPGTGVGLASVRRIVRRHGGEIWAESEVGRGSAFYFTLRA